MKNEYASYSYFGKVWYDIKEYGNGWRDFGLKLLPRYMPENYENPDLRTKYQKPVVPFNANKIKPGNDYFNGNFFTLMFIFFYTLCFFRGIKGYRGGDGEL